MKIKQRGRGGKTPSRTNQYLLPNQGFALVSTIIALLVLTVMVTVALKSSVLGEKLAYFRKEKIGLNLVAQEALDKIQLRISQRMNPPPTTPAGASWTVDTYRYQVAVGGSCDGGSRTINDCMCNGGTCYHGYRFQRGTDINSALDEYSEDFGYESSQQIGIFEPCTVANGHCPANAQWSAKLVTNPISLAPNGSIDILNNQNDRAYRADVEVTSFDERSGKRAILRADLLLVAGTPTSDSSFATYANVISRMSLFSGYIKGAVAQYLDPDLLPKSAAGTPINEPLWNFGEMGMLDYTCKRYTPFTLRPPCSLNGLERPDWERADYFTNMKVGGLISNFGTGTLLSPHSINPASPGLTVDDNDWATGDSNMMPPDSLINQDPITTSLIGSVLGRDQYGGVPNIQVGTLATILNRGGSASLSFDGTANCILLSTGSLDSFSAPTTVPPLTQSAYSVVLQPNAGCGILINGTYVINGDLIIAGSDGLGQFKNPTAGQPLNGTLWVTGNVYILNNVNISNGPPEATGVDRTGDSDPANDFRNDAWKASNWKAAHLNTEFDRLGIVAHGHIIIGNLANSNNFAHAMTYANSEIAYFNLDLTGDNHMDLLVPDGARPSSTNPLLARASGITNYQVRRESCLNQKTRYLPYRPTFSCESKAIGLLPEGSILVDSSHRYNFAFTEVAPNEQVGYGYVRNPADITAPLLVPVSGKFDDSGVRNQVTLDAAAFQSDLPFGGASSDLFQGGWVSTTRFRQFAGATLGGTGHQHDSFDPAYINRAHYIAAKLYAGQTILGLASFEDKYTLPNNTLVPNPDSPLRPLPKNFAAYANAAWSFNLLKDVNNSARYNHLTSGPGRRCTAFPADVPYNIAVPAPRRQDWTGIDIFGGVFARYVNITSTNGLCIYSDDRSADLGHEPINVIPGGAYHEDPNAQ